MKFRTKPGNFTKEPAPSNKFSALRIILIILLITNLVSFIVWQNIKGLDLDRQISTLEKDQLELYHIYNDRLIQYEKMKQDPTLERYARNHLGMVSSKRQNIVKLGISSKEKLMQILMIKDQTK